MKTNLDTNKDTPFVYMGLDIETTASVSWGEVIQVGLYIDEELHYSSDVGHRGKFFYEQEALNINGFTFERIFNGKPVYLVDKELDDVIMKAKSKYDVQGRHLIPVGFNIGSFDIPYIRKTFSLFMSGLSYRSVDLNAVLATLFQTESEFLNAKYHFKEQAIETLKAKGWSENQHDALYDARLALQIHSDITASFQKNLLYK